MVAKKMLIGGNWKCNGITKSVKELVGILNNGGNFPENAEVVVAPTALHAAFVVGSLRKDVSVSVQNLFTEAKGGAWTGELTPDVVKDIGINWAILGHSERRQIIGESPELVATKTKNALDNGMKVILCIGETLEDRESGSTMKKCISQLAPVFEIIKSNQLKDICIAYEPIWAIGTGKTATPALAQETHAELRGWLNKNIGEEAAHAMRIIYGGSVKGANCEDLMKETDIDGFLVGGASLKKEFIDIIKSASIKSKI